VNECELNERFHRTLKAEVFAFDRFRDIAAVQRAFDAWRELYNFERPHGALDHDVPASRYRPGPRAMPGRLPEPVCDKGEIVRKVSATKPMSASKAGCGKFPKLSAENASPSVRSTATATMAFSSLPITSQQST
jgi:putative transposase